MMILGVMCSKAAWKTLSSPFEEKFYFTFSATFFWGAKLFSFKNWSKIENFGGHFLVVMFW
jgi:hypothetical protein